MEYTKQPISIQDQIDLLKRRGLIIDDEQHAKDALSVISYFRLADYWRPMEASHTTHIFIEGTHFNDILKLYQFDKELKNMVFAAIQTIEIAMRTKIIHHFSIADGAFWYMDAHLFADHSLFASHLEKLNKELQRAKDEFITDHYKKYGREHFPPSWKTLEVASLGSLSKLYENYASRRVKNLVARDFNVMQYVFLSSWLVCLTVLRNCCAHHARLWNRRFSVRPKMPPQMPGKWISNFRFLSYKLYPNLCCIAYWLNSIKADNTFAADLRDLLTRYPDVPPSSMGFPHDWQGEELWK